MGVRGAVERGGEFLDRGASLYCPRRGENT
jgi:hypothetical protein